MVHGRRFVAVDLAECIDMADKRTTKREEPPSEDQTAEGVTPDMLEWMSRELLGIESEEDTKKSEEDTKKFSEGGANFSQDSRGTGAALTGRNFRGVF